jgi:hypothetical protein
MYSVFTCGNNKKSRGDFLITIRQGKKGGDVRTTQCYTVVNKN